MCIVPISIVQYSMLITVRYIQHVHVHVYYVHVHVTMYIIKSIPLQYSSGGMGGEGH